jgi:hypothetical protein
LGFNVILVNPKGTTNSEDHEKVMREKGFNRHTASAYLIALKGLKVIKNNEKLRKNVTDILCHLQNQQTETVKRSRVG